MSLPLVTVCLLAMAIWTGGIVAIVVVARVAATTLDARQRVDFFRALGRSYGSVATVALVVGLVTGAALLRDHPWDGVQVAAACVAGALLATTAVGILQARAMTRLRRRALTAEASSSGALRRGARLAGALRGAIGLLTLGLVILGAALAVS